MIIRRNVQFSLKSRTYKGKKISEKLPIRIRVSYNSKRADIMTGFFVDKDDWDTTQQRVKKNATGKNGEKATTINAYLNRAAYEMDEAFKEFEVLGRYPTPAELEDTFDNRMAEINPRPSKVIKTRFWEALDRFVAEESSKNSWQYSTVQKFRTFGNHVAPSPASRTSLKRD